jgi:cell division protein YceG involved in septum cleavage
MLIGADISLCYFFKIPYADCTPSFIARNVFDTKNPYNTRTVAGLPPTPVGNPTLNSIMASLQPTYTDYLYYLHDNKGQIYYGKTLEEHNANKRNYLR